tara:strand:- start:668 stop:943 length:276 start_codon:yes stop_codon:yes gene_type:complete
MINEFDREMRTWNNKCPKCGQNIHWSLRSRKLGATSTARCGNSLGASRIINLDEVIDGGLKVCDWEGVAVRMWDGSVRFREKDGRYLLEWK